MMNISYFEHRDLSDTIKSQIIDLKNQHWSYSFEQHSEWIDKNLSKDDIHLLILDDENELLAYLNFINIELTSEGGFKEKVLGIGNVCVNKIKEKRGLGTLIMNAANYYLKNKQKQGVLLCRNSLVPFYEKTNWTLFKGQFSIANKKPEVALLSLEPLLAQRVDLDKNF